MVASTWNLSCRFQNSKAKDWMPELFSNNFLLTCWTVGSISEICFHFFATWVVTSTTGWMIAWHVTMVQLASSEPIVSSERNYKSPADVIHLEVNKLIRQRIDDHIWSVRSSTLGVQISVGLQYDWVWVCSDAIHWMSFINKNNHLPSGSKYYVGVHGS